MDEIHEQPVTDRSAALIGSLPEPSPTRPTIIALRTLIDAYLQEYEVRQFRLNIARCRVAHLRAHFGDCRGG